ncbi:MAG: asparagine synthase (glutamine-hydrolyzing) [Christensenellaceae bacterium]|jgi:asparagine synthase (glutamine-hydrolysing)|nr:asparagine synthase (glutamine-hydrolyzing) [Christensenellaceae bacterium]
MCGIAGHLSYDNELDDLKIYQNMSDQLSRRGPDEKGFFKTHNCVLLHRRLIVIDPVNGAQPMSINIKGDTYTIVYNGELYNTNEIREELLRAGYNFKGYSDTEIVLYSYIEWNKECLYRLNGIFSLAIYMSRSNELFAARDRLGVKPFYYYNRSRYIIFASEIGALLEHPKVSRVIDSFGLKQLLLMGPGKSCGRTSIKNVFELKPGQFLKFSVKGLHLETYWKLTASVHTETLNETIQKTKSLITDAIKGQLVSDVPLACFLSGGLDSTVIAKIAANYYHAKKERLCTYSVDYMDNEKFFSRNFFQPDSDNSYIDIASKYINSKHKKILLDSIDVAHALEIACDARSTPGMADIDSSLLLFCKQIKKNHTVCLSGEGADEVFGGYPWYLDESILFKDTFPWANSIKLRKKLFNSDLIGMDADEFVANEYRNVIAKADSLDTDNVYDRRMREMYVLNIYGFLQTLLDRKDRMSMYSGLEVRVPFCDYRIVEYGYNMPNKFKFLNGREKGIVRAAFKNDIPSAIVKRKKNPYPKTHNPVFLEKVLVKLRSIISNKNCALLSFVNIEFLNEMIKNSKQSTHYWYGQLMTTPQIFAFLIQIEYFIKKFDLSY